MRPMFNGLNFVYAYIRLSHDISFVFALRIYKGLFSESFCVCEKARFALQAKGGMLVNGNS